MVFSTILDPWSDDLLTDKRLNSMKKLSQRTVVIIIKGQEH
jgi:hypothetical protein